MTCVYKMEVVVMTCNDRMVTCVDKMVVVVTCSNKTYGGEW